MARGGTARRHSPTRSRRPRRRPRRSSKASCQLASRANEGCCGASAKLSPMPAGSSLACSKGKPARCRAIPTTWRNSCESTPTRTRARSRERRRTSISVFTFSSRLVSTSSISALATEANGWEATPHQRFERLLRETGVFAGVMITDKELRLIYAPRGETSGWVSFPLRSLATVAGRPMLAGLKLVLGSFRLFNAPAEQRLRALLKHSREAQAAVSAALAEQVLGALHELLRGFSAAEHELIGRLARDDPQHLYEGLLAVLMRLVFVLYAEDRDLIPSHTDAIARKLYDDGYSVRGLYAKLTEDAALNPDTMEERYGSWGRLLALFRLIHQGHRSGFVQARGGKLFDPDVFPFLEGRADKADAPRVLKITDGCLLRILEGLMTVREPKTKVRQRLSYRALDVEPLGSVYETIMGFTVQVGRGRVLAIRAGKNNRTPVFADLDQLAALKPADRPRYLKEACNRANMPAA